MPDIETMMIFISTVALFGVVPGPDNIFVLTQSALVGPRSGLAAALGLCLGLMVHTIAVAAGLDPRPRLWGFDVVGAGVEEARRRAADAGLEADYRIGAFGIVDGVQPDVAIVDPPRKGCGPAAITALLESRPKTLLYVSCHAASLGRDTARIEELGYTATTLWPADMLPQTGHLELLARFDLQTG